MIDDEIIIVRKRDGKVVRRIPVVPLLLLLVALSTVGALWGLLSR